MPEEKINPEVKPNYEENSMPAQDEYSQVEKQVQNMKLARVQQEYMPENPIDTANLLLSNSDTSELMLEMDKEIKLANLDNVEKFSIYQFVGVWNDMMFIKEQQEKKAIEAEVKYKSLGCLLDKDGNPLEDNSKSLYDLGNHEQIMKAINESIEKKNPDFFDASGAYKKSRFLATLSRGKGGFERIQQIRTISEYKMEQTDITEKSPGFMQKFMGGFRR